MHLIRSQADLERAKRQRFHRILLYLEGLDFLGTDARVCWICFGELGVMGASLVWSRRNLLACGCCRASENKAVSGEVTEAGRCVIEKMGELGCFWTSAI